MNSIGFKINKINKEVIQENEVCCVEATISVDNKRKCIVRAEKVNGDNSIRTMYVPLEVAKIVPELSRDVKKFIEDILKTYILSANNITKFDFKTDRVEDNCSLEE